MLKRPFPRPRFQVLNDAVIEELLGSDVDTYTDLAPFFLAAVIVNGGTFNPAWLDQLNFEPVCDLASKEQILRVYHTRLSASAAELPAAALQRRHERAEYRQHDFNPLVDRPFVVLPDGIGLAPQPLFVMGDPAGVRAILGSVIRTRTAYLAALPEHLDAVAELYRVEPGPRMVRMWVDRTTFRPIIGEAVRLDAGDTRALNRLYELGLTAWLPTESIASGVYYGIRRGGRLVAAAGTHVISPTYGLAAVGNVYTHRDMRGRGFAKAVTGGTAHCFNNSGQSCNAPTRMLVPMARMAEAAAIAKAVADKTKVGDPRAADTNLGPVVNRIQWDKIQGLIKKGIDEGAKVEAGGLGLPDGLNKGFYVRPTVFSHVTNDMTIAREEIFGPVLSIMAYDTEDEAIDIANDTPFGLAGFVQSKDVNRARRVANRIRAGRVYLNGAPFDRSLPFGGYKQSGNGREFGVFGFEEYLEVKAILG